MDIQHRVLAPQSSLDLTSTNGTSKKRAHSPAHQQGSDTWVSKRSKSEPTSLHEAIKSNDFESFKGMLGDKSISNIVNAKDSDGNTPLHIAASLGNLRMIEALLDYGANTMSINNMGMNPLWMAAEEDRMGAVETLLSAMQSGPSEPEGFWYTKEGISKLLDQAGKARAKTHKGKEHHVDNFVSKITGESTSDLNDHAEVYKYVSHLNSWVGSTLGTNDEGWYFDSVLVQRIRSLSHILLDRKVIPQEARGNLSPEEAREALKGELAGMLNTLQAARKQHALAILSNKDSAHKLNQHEASQIISRIFSLKPGESTILPLGFPGHAIYMTITREKGSTDHLLFQVANLGAGYTRAHDYNKVSQVLPKSFKVPASDAASFSKLFPMMNQFFSGIYRTRSINRSANWQDLYLVVNNFQRDLKALFGKEATIVSSEEQKSKGMKAQTAGNCALKNHSSAMAMHLGKPLFKWFKSMEKKYAMNRSENLITQTLYKEKELQKEQEHLKELLSIGSHGFDRVRSYLSKARHPGIAATIGADTLASLIVAGESQILDALIKLGSKINVADAQGNTLLHCAVKEGDLSSTRVLLEHGMAVDLQNARGRSALHYAMDQQNQDMVTLLKEFGADPYLQDNDEKTPMDLLGEKMASAVEIINMYKLSAVKA